MIASFVSDYSLRGYTFEYAAKVLLRRERQNNFIFQTNQFDSFQELINKYRLLLPDTFDNLNDVYRLHKFTSCDVIEFVLNNKTERKVEDIIFYEVKTKWHSLERKYFEICTSNLKFLKACSKQGYKIHIVSMILFDNWRFSCSILPFEKQNIREYSNFKK